MADQGPSWETLFTLSNAMFITVTLKYQDRELTYWLVDSARGLPTREQFEGLLHGEKHEPSEGDD